MDIFWPQGVGAYNIVFCFYANTSLVAVDIDKDLGPTMSKARAGTLEPFWFGLST